MGTNGASSDVQLLVQWRDGDRRAGNHLVRRYHVAISNFFKNAVGDDVRQDLVQETFRGLTSAKETFRAEGSVRGFIFGVARKVLLDHLRKRYRTSKRFDPLTHSVEDVDGATPSKVVAELRKSHRLLACIRALPADAKQLLELYYWQELTADELGRVFAQREGSDRVIPAGTIRRWIHDTKKKLRACVEAGAGPRPGENENDEMEPLEDEFRALGELLAMGPGTPPSEG